MATAPLPSRGPKARQNGYITSVFPRILHAGRNLKMATSPLPSEGPKFGHHAYMTPTLSGIPSAPQGETQNSRLHPYLLGGGATVGRMAA